jgi:hypothetical protein
LDPIYKGKTISGAAKDRFGVFVETLGGARGEGLRRVMEEEEAAAARCVRRELQRVTARESV